MLSGPGVRCSQVPYLIESKLSGKTTCVCLEESFIARGLLFHGSGDLIESSVIIPCGIMILKETKMDTIETLVGHLKN